MERHIYEKLMLGKYFSTLSRFFFCFQQVFNEHPRWIQSLLVQKQTQCTIKLSFWLVFAVFCVKMCRKLFPNVYNDARWYIVQAGTKVTFGLGHQSYLYFVSSGKTNNVLYWSKLQVSYDSYSNRGKHSKKKETTTVVQRVGMKNVYSLLSRFGRGIENCSSEHTF